MDLAFDLVGAAGALLAGVFIGLFYWRTLRQRENAYDVAMRLRLVGFVGLGLIVISSIERIVN